MYSMPIVGTSARLYFSNESSEEPTGRYKRVSTDRVTSLDTPTHHGIGGFYVNANPPPNYVILDAKYMSADSAVAANKAPSLGTTNSGKQLGDDWITKNIESAVDEKVADKIISDLLKNPSNIERCVAKTYNKGNITYYYVDNMRKIIKNADRTPKVWNP